MKSLAPLTLCVMIAVGCDNRAASRPASGANDRRIATPGACIDTAGEEQALPCAPPTVRRSGDSLSIRLTDGRTLTFVNTRGEAEHGTMFRGTIASVPLYITSSYGGERPPTYSMIDGRTGAELEFEDLPLFAPDSMRFAVYAPSWDDCELGDGARLSVWRLTDGLPVQEWSVKSWGCGPTPGWAADQLRWRAPDTLAFMRHDIDPVRHAGGPPRMQLLVRADSTWRVVAAPNTQQ